MMPCQIIDSCTDDLTHQERPRREEAARIAIAPPFNGFGQVYLPAFELSFPGQPPQSAELRHLAEYLPAIQIRQPPRFLRQPATPDTILIFNSRHSRQITVAYHAASDGQL